MLSKKIFTKETKRQTRNYFDMPATEKKKVLKEAVKKANKEQLDLVKNYEKQVGEKVDLEKCRS